MSGHQAVTEQEKTLIASCLKGEKAAWDNFVGQYSGLVYHTIKKTFSLHHTEPRPDSVEDLFQEVFVSLIKEDFAQLRRFRGDNGCTLASWLRMIAARRTVDQLRKAKPDTQTIADASADQSGDPSVPMLDRQLSESLGRALENLPARDRLLVDLFFYQNLSAQDVASILHTSIGAVYTHKSRILAKLRKTLEKLDSL